MDPNSCPGFSTSILAPCLWKAPEDGPKLCTYVGDLEVPDFTSIPCLITGAWVFGLSSHTPYPKQSVAPLSPNPSWGLGCRILSWRSLPSSRILKEKKNRQLFWHSGIIYTNFASATPRMAASLWGEVTEAAAHSWGCLVTWPSLGMFVSWLFFFCVWITFIWHDISCAKCGCTLCVIHCIMYEYIVAPLDTDPASLNPCCCFNGLAGLLQGSVNTSCVVSCPVPCLRGHQGHEPSSPEQWW